MIETRSALARSLDIEGRMAVDRLERWREQPISTADAADLYRRAVCCTAERAMREELEPYWAWAARWLSMSVEPGKSIPAELQAVMDGIVAKWSAAVAELVQPISATPAGAPPQTDLPPG